MSQFRGFCKKRPVETVVFRPKLSVFCCVVAYFCSVKISFNRIVMKPNVYYLKYALGLMLFLLLVGFLLGDFFPLVKSFFLKDQNSAEVFAACFGKVNWLRDVTQSLVLGSLLAFHRRYADRKAAV